MGSGKEVLVTLCGVCHPQRLGHLKTSTKQGFDFSRVSFGQNKTNHQKQLSNNKLLTVILKMQILHVSASAWMRDSAKCKIFKSPTLHKLLTVFFVNSVLIHNNNNNKIY